MIAFVFVTAVEENISNKVMNNNFTSSLRTIQSRTFNSMQKSNENETVLEFKEYFYMIGLQSF